VRMVAKQIPPPRKLVEIDEVWLKEWIAYGFVEMDAYLALRAAFDAYCVTHPRPKE
jgi:hypothetical protein